MESKFLQGRVAMVTGGASGMGRAIALALAEAGANVAIGSLLSAQKSSLERGELAYLPGQEELEKTAEKIRALGVECFAQNLDVTSTESVLEFFDATRKQWDNIDILANAAGITAEQTLSEHPEDLWHKVVDVNLNGTFRTMKLCLPLMMQRGWGRIINIASTAATVGAPTSSAYCASKAGVVGLSKCAALEGAAHGVTCNTISPTWVETRFGMDWMGHIAEEGEQRSKDAYVADVKKTNPQGRLIQPTEIGALAVYLCRDEALGITMQDLTVSAGSLW